MLYSYWKATEEALKTIEKINFDSEETISRIQKWDDERRSNEEKLVEMEAKEREDSLKPLEKEDFDFMYRCDSLNPSGIGGVNFVHNYKKRYSARYSMAPSMLISQQSYAKSKLTNNTNSLTSLGKIGSPQLSASTAPSTSSATLQLPSIYNPSSLKPSNPSL